MTERLLAIVFSLLLLLQIPIYHDGTKGGIDSEIAVNWGAYGSDGISKVSIDIEIQGGFYPEEFTAVAFPTNQKDRKAGDVVIHVGTNSSTENCNPVKRQYGIWDHLNSEFESLESNHNLLLYEDELPNWSDSSSEEVTVIITGSGITLSPELSNLRDWIENGGVLFTIGDWFNRDSSAFNRLTRSTTTIESGSWEFLDSASEVAEALGLMTRHFSTGVTDSDLASIEGMGIGYISDSNFSSIEMIPIGSGAIVTLPCIKGSKFGTDESSIARDIAALIDSNFLYSVAGSNFIDNQLTTSHLVWGEISVDRGQEKTISLEVDFPASRFNGINVYIFSNSLHSHKSAFHSFESIYTPEDEMRRNRVPYNDAIIKITENDIELEFVSLSVENGFGLISSSPNSHKMNNNIHMYISESAVHCSHLGGGETYTETVLEELSKLEYYEVVRLNFTGLEEFVEENEDGVLIVMGTVLPASVFGVENDRLTPWIESGGTLIWIGDRIGGSSLNDMSEDFFWGNEESLRKEGSAKILDSQLLSDSLPWGTKATNLTGIGESLGVGFDSIVVAPELGALDEIGGIALGKIGEYGGVFYSSVSLIPVGNGGVVLFGGCPTAEQNPASLVSDIDSVIDSGLIRNNGNGEITVETFEIPGGRYLNHRVNLDQFNLSSDGNVIILKIPGSRAIQLL